MKKATLWSLGGIVLAGSLGLNAQVLQINSGWQILGAAENITNMSVFKSDCVSSLYTYRNSSDGYRLYKPSSTSNQISALNAGDGFWISGLSNCTIDTTGSFGAASSTPPPPPTTTATTTPTSSVGSSTTGRTLYDANCAGCHGTTKLGKSAANIASAIASNRGGMSSLSFLTTTQIQAIAAAATTSTYSSGKGNKKNDDNEKDND